MKRRRLPIVLVFRRHTGCRQYCFYDRASLRAWCARRPYRDEDVRVMFAVIGERYDGPGPAEWMRADQLPGTVERLFPLLPEAKRGGGSR